MDIGSLPVGLNYFISKHDESYGVCLKSLQFFLKKANSSPSCLGPSNCIAKHHCMHSVVDGAIVSPHTYMHTCTLSLNLSMPTSLSNVLDSVRLHSGVLYYSVLPPPPRSPKIHSHICIVPFARMISMPSNSMLNCKLNSLFLKKKK